MRIIKSNKAVNASSNLEPRQRTAADGKTWWVVFDNATKKYLDNITFFGKYTTKKDCQFAIDSAVEKYGDLLQRTLDNHRKYFSDENPTEINSCSDVKASKWIPRGGVGYECPNCGYISDFGRPDFCPKCESDMRTGNVNASTVCGASEETLTQLFKDAKDIVDYFQYHNKNLNKRQDELLMDLSDAIDSGSTVGVRDAIENLKYNTKGMTKEQEYKVMDLYCGFNYSDGKYNGLGRPANDDEESIMESKKLSANDQALTHIKAAIDILGKSGNKDTVTKDTIANLGVVMFDLMATTTVNAGTSKCKYSKTECIDAIQYQYGMNKREAEDYYKTADCKLLETLVDGFKGNAKKAFYDD